MIQMQLASKIWHVRQPEITRVIDSIYVDAFFADGSIRLSSMEKFRSYPDEERGDPREGERHARHTNAQGSQFVFINAQPAGHNAYVLSFTSNNHAGGMQTFGNSAFRVKSSFQFGAALSAAIPNFVEGIEGPCIYTDQFALDRNIGAADDALFSNEDGFQIGGPSQSHVLAQMQAGPEFYFKKRTRYAPQNEYRMVWFVSGAAQPYLDIKCPAAVAVCERVNLA
jgi:hypothetical protein